MCGFENTKRSERPWGNSWKYIMESLKVIEQKADTMQPEWDFRKDFDSRHRAARDLKNNKEADTM